MDRALRRYTELINCRNKLNEEHPEWNLVDVIRLTEKLIAIRIPITQRQVSFLAEQMPMDPTVEASVEHMRRIDYDEVEEAVPGEASEDVHNAICIYWKEALQLNLVEYMQLASILEAVADAWAE